MPKYDYTKYANRSDADLDNRAQAKETELSFILANVKIRIRENPKVIVLGCPDRRMIPAYESMFRKYFGPGTQLTVIDIEVGHLIGIQNVIQHDATTPLPNPHYDLVYSHVLLKFIETQKQWDVIQNAYNALSPGGVAIFTLDQEDVDTKEVLQQDGWYSVPIDKWLERLVAAGIGHEVLPFDLEHSIPGAQDVRGTRGLVLIVTK